jgi:hypothetical protein
MNAATVRRIEQDIRCQREVLTNEELWLREQPASEHRREGFLRIRWWRESLADIEKRLTQKT